MTFPKFKKRSIEKDPTALFKQHNHPKSQLSPYRLLALDFTSKVCYTYRVKHDIFLIWFNDIFYGHLHILQQLIQHAHEEFMLIFFLHIVRLQGLFLLLLSWGATHTEFWGLCDEDQKTDSYRLYGENRC